MTLDKSCYPSREVALLIWVDVANEEIVNGYCAIYEELSMLSKAWLELEPHTFK